MNLIGRFRSNYFAVRDRAAFEAWCRQLHLRPITDDGDPTLVGFLNDGNEAGIPWTLMDGDDFQDIDFIGELGDFLQDNQVAIVIGIAYAVNNKGEEKRIDLADIMTQAKPLGEHVTKCEY